jgi:hypothetical protein
MISRLMTSTTTHAKERDVGGERNPLTVRETVRVLDRILPVMFDNRKRAVSRAKTNLAEENCLSDEGLQRLLWEMGDKTITLKKVQQVMDKCEMEELAEGALGAHYNPIFDGLPGRGSSLESGQQQQQQEQQQQQQQYLDDGMMGSGGSAHPRSSVTRISEGSERSGSSLSTRYSSASRASTQSTRALGIASGREAQQSSGDAMVNPLVVGAAEASVDALSADENNLGENSPGENEYSGHSEGAKGAGGSDGPTGSNGTIGDSVDDGELLHGGPFEQPQKVARRSVRPSAHREFTRGGAGAGDLAGGVGVGGNSDGRTSSIRGISASGIRTRSNTETALLGMKEYAALTAGETASQQMQRQVSLASLKGEAGGGSETTEHHDQQQQQQSPQKRISLQPRRLSLARMRANSFRLSKPREGKAMEKELSVAAAADSSSGGAGRRRESVDPGSSSSDGNGFSGWGSQRGSMVAGAAVAVQQRTSAGGGTGRVERRRSNTMMSHAMLLEAERRRHELGQRQSVQAHQSRRQWSFQQFVTLMHSKWNSAFDPQSEHEVKKEDLQRPITDYYINSSHNTYIEGGQIWGKAKVEMYARVLLAGCRSVELDIWNGKDEQGRDMPVIYHGWEGVERTGKISFRSILEVINESAFVNSKMPVVLSFENHCTPEQQAVLARDLQEVLGDKLYLHDKEMQESETAVPSPWALREKILVKGKVNRNRNLGMLYEWTEEDGEEEAESDSEEEEEEEVEEEVDEFGEEEGGGGGGGGTLDVSSVEGEVLGYVSEDSGGIGGGSSKQERATITGILYMKVPSGYLFGSSWPEVKCEADPRDGSFTHGPPIISLAQPFTGMLVQEASYEAQSVELLSQRPGKRPFRFNLHTRVGKVVELAAANESEYNRWTLGLHRALAGVGDLQDSTTSISSMDSSMDSSSAGSAIGSFMRSVSELTDDDDDDVRNASSNRLGSQLYSSTASTVDFDERPRGGSESTDLDKDLFESGGAKGGPTALALTSGVYANMQSGVSGVQSGVQSAMQSGVQPAAKLIGKVQMTVQSAVGADGMGRGGGRGSLEATSLNPTDVSASRASRKLLAKDGSRKVHRQSGRKSKKDGDREGGRGSQNSDGKQTGKKLSGMKIHSDLEKLTYLRAFKFKSIDVKRNVWKSKLKPYDMCSVTEPKAQNYCLKLGGNIIAYTHRNMMRVYPNKTRTNSSNFDPLWAWGCGVQMVALNHQTPGRMMDLNRGVFKQNGNCGYVLKPKCILPKTNPHGPERYGSSVRERRQSFARVKSMASLGSSSMRTLVGPGTAGRMSTQNLHSLAEEGGSARANSSTVSMRRHSSRSRNASSASSKATARTLSGGSRTLSSSSSASINLSSKGKKVAHPLKPVADHKGQVQILRVQVLKGSNLFGNSLGGGGAGPLRRAHTSQLQQQPQQLPQLLPQMPQPSLVRDDSLERRCASGGAATSGTHSHLRRSVSREVRTEEKTDRSDEVLNGSTGAHAPNGSNRSIGPNGLDSSTGGALMTGHHPSQTAAPSRGSQYTREQQPYVEMQLCSWPHVQGSKTKQGRRGSAQGADPFKTTGVKKVKTKVGKGSSPTYREEFVFPFFDKEMATIEIQVKNKGSRDGYLAATVIPLQALREGYRVVLLQNADGEDICDGVGAGDGPASLLCVFSFEKSSEHLEVLLNEKSVLDTNGDLFLRDALQRGKEVGGGSVKGKKSKVAGIRRGSGSSGKRGSGRPGSSKKGAKSVGWRDVSKSEKRGEGGGEEDENEEVEVLAGEQAIERHVGGGNSTAVV